MPTIEDVTQITERPSRLLTIKENATVAEAAKKMADHQIGCLVVLDTQDKFAGLLTERDMLAKVLKASLAPDDVVVRDIMTVNVVSCTMQTPLAKAEKLMAEHKIRHILIVTDDTPIGMLSIRDIIAYQRRANEAAKTAAEQVAMLSAGLQSHDFNYIIALTINQIPESFQADGAVLYFPQKDILPPIVYRKNCPLSQEDLPEPLQVSQNSPDGQPVYGEICGNCRSSGGQSSRLIIPLNINEYDSTDDKPDTTRQGFLCMCRFDPSSTETRQLRLYKASLLQKVLNVNLTNAKLYQNCRQARHDSETDPLTGIGTRRVIRQALSTECGRAVRYGNCFSVAIIDVDNFKQINDSAGHAAGDTALCRVARIMSSNARATDILSRYGGDEFVLLMPETKLNEATELLERLRHRIKNISIPDVKSITISCGLAEWTDSPADTAETIMERADTALYKAKEQGRNRVVAAQPTAMS